MMNNILKKTTNKKFLIVTSCVTALLTVLAIVLTLVFAFRYAPTVDDRKTLTVTVDDYFFNTNLDEVKDVCENAFEEKYAYCYEGVMSGESELVYVFDKDAPVATIEKAVREAVLSQMKAGGSLEDATQISVTSNLESSEPEIPFSYGYRAVAGVALFAVLAFLYVALRFRLNMGIATAVSILVSAILSTSLVLVTRIAITGSTFYAIAVSVLVTAVFTLLTLSKLRTKLKEETAENESAEEVIVSSVATKEIVIISATLGVALVVIGAIATAVTRWFALTSLVCLVASAFVGLFYLPALYLPMLNKARAKTAGQSKSGYVGAKKGFLKKDKAQDTATQDTTSQETAE